MNCRLVFRVILVLLIARLVYNKDDPHVFHNTEKDVRESNLPFFQNGYFKITAAFSCDAAEELLKVIYLELKALSLATLLTTVLFGYLLGWLFLKAVGYKDKEKERLLLKVTEYRKLCMKLERDVYVHRRARLNIRNDLGRANARLAKLARENKLSVADNSETFRDVEAEAFKKEQKLGSALKEIDVLKKENAKNQNKLNDALDELSVMSNNEATFRVELALAKAKLDIMDQQASKFKKETAFLIDEAAKNQKQFEDVKNELLVVSDNEATVRVELALTKAKLEIMNEEALKLKDQLQRSDDERKKKELELDIAEKELQRSDDKRKKKELELDIAEKKVHVMF
ncbi:uncharacterized protein LOC144650244 isoform X2 [Oculina patagonica]